MPVDTCCRRFFDGERPVTRGLCSYGSEFVGTAIAVAVAAAGTAVSTYAQYEQGQAQQEASKFNAKVAENQAVAATQAAQVQEAQVRERNRRLQATARAALGGSGVTTEGSPLLVLMDNAQQAELEARLQRAQGSRAAAGYQAESGLQSFYGQQAGIAGTLNAGRTLLTGAYNLTRQNPSSAPLA